MDTPVRPHRLAAWALLLAPLTSCIGYRVVNPIMPNAQELLEFESAGPVAPEIDTDKLLALFVGKGEYQVVAGDLLEIDLPKELTGGDTESGDTVEKIRARISREGKISLPQIGEVEVTGKPLAEIEATVVALYHPDYIQQKPNIVVTVSDYRTASVAVLGSVATPGIQTLRSDRLSLLGALMAAGGINEDRGAGMIRITGAEGAEEPVLLPVRDTNIPFQDISLKGGETITVESLPEENFTALGLVNRPGAFPYPHTQTYNLMQALAIAGGVNETAAPRYATIYRQKQNGEIIGATFKIDGTSLQDASNVRVKPGDVIAVDHTQGSWTRQFISQVFGFRASFSATSVGSL